MPLAKTTELLRHAQQNGYGIPAINTFNFETMKYAVLAAERENMPLILQFYPGLAVHCPESIMAFTGKDLAKKASVPVAVHLDHSVEYSIAVGGIRDGFPSVMVDGSSLPYEENAALTKSVVHAAAVFGVDVEAEFGHVSMGTDTEAYQNSDNFTDPELAARFIADTGCDSLAVAVGNAHGAYTQMPNLDFDRIAALRQKLPVPLVLHGCSDIPPEQLQQAVRLGISKYNIATEYFRAMMQDAKRFAAAADADASGYDMMVDIGEAMIDFVRSKIRLLNPDHYHLG